MTDEELKQQTLVLLKKVESYNPKADLKFVEKAVRFAYDAHKGQKRESGDEYFTHCYNTAMTVAEFKMDYHSIAAALLHDVIEDTSVTAATIQKEFDKETVELIISLTKLKKIDEKSRIYEPSDMRSENIRKIILATAKDVRVIIIKLADRLHNMRTLKYRSRDKQKTVAQETMDIYAPIAHKLGMNSVKSELEDISFRFLEPEIYTDFKNKISLKRDEREKQIEIIIKEIRQALKDGGIEAEVYGRAKHFYSIYKKMKTDNKEFSEIYDLNAIRIIVSTVAECYAALGIVHKIWKPIPKKFKDYIATPKSNNYQSLHTTVRGSHGRILEVQIRTQEMHFAAEEGIAAHWRYKEQEQDKRFDRRLEWLKQIINWRQKSADAHEFVELLKVDLFQKEIFVFTPKGDTIALPEGATPVDFAYAVHSDVGTHCKSAKVNGIIVPLDHKLSSGDIVEIITQKNVMPSRAWLSFVKSASTKVKIKKALGIEYETAPKPPDKVKRNQGLERSKTRGLEFKDGNILYNGKVPNVKIPKCCNPKMGDKIRAFKTRDRKIVIHKADCINLHAYDAKSEIKPQVSESVLEIHNLHVNVVDRIGLLAEILTLIAKEKFNVKTINTKFGKSDHAVITVGIEENPEKDIAALIQKMSKIRNVYGVDMKEE